VKKIAPQRQQVELSDTQLPCRSIERIANHWVFQRGEVHSNLMRAPGVELDLHQRRAVDLGELFPVCARLAGIGDGFTMPRICAAWSCACGGLGRAPMASSIRAALLSKNALHQRNIRFLDGAQAKRFAEFGVRGIVSWQPESRRKFPCRAGARCLAEADRLPAIAIGHDPAAR